MLLITPISGKGSTLYNLCTLFILAEILAKILRFNRFYIPVTWRSWKPRRDAGAVSGQDRQGHRFCRSNLIREAQRTRSASHPVSMLFGYFRESKVTRRTGAEPRLNYLKSADIRPARLDRAWPGALESAPVAWITTTRLLVSLAPIRRAGDVTRREKQ